MPKQVFSILVYLVLIGSLNYFLQFGMIKSLDVEVKVSNLDGAIQSAIITFENRKVEFVSNKNGLTFVPRSLIGAEVSVAAVGHFIAHGRIKNNNNQIFLNKVEPLDSNKYLWVHPFEGEQNCNTCHAAIVNEWKHSGHAQSSVGYRFLEMIGEKKNDGKPVQGWSLSRDLPEGKTVCVSCHAPGVGAGQAGLENIEEVVGVDRLGVHCDFCHKVGGIKQKEVGLAHGRDLLELYRPEKGQVFFGPMKNAKRNDNSFTPVFQQSVFCASCHEGTMFGIHAYTTFSEWKKSPAAAQGLQCQACHMKPDGKMENIAPGKGGIKRNPMELASHQLMPGGLKLMLQSSISHQEEIIRSEKDTLVRVRIKAINVGHKIPTGYIDRHLILELRATGGGKEILPLEGDLIPIWADVDLAGNAGVVFARPLLDHGKKQLQPFWLASEDLIDTRLEPEVTREHIWKFPKELESLKVQMIYRPFWKEQQKIKKWSNQDLLIFESILQP